MEHKEVWRKCVCCKKEILVGGTYQVCSNAACRKSVFCSVECWDTHNSVMAHKSAWAEEETAPLSSDEHVARKVIVESAAPKAEKVAREILVVASKMKAYIKAKHDLNTSGDVMDALSDILRFQCDQAAEKARQDGRKTLMERDF